MIRSREENYTSDKIPFKIHPISAFDLVLLLLIFEK